MKANARGWIQGLVAAALFGVATPLSKYLLDGISPQVLAGLFYLGAALALIPAEFRASESGASRGLPKDRKNRLYLGGAILFGGVLGPLLLLVGLDLARASSVSMLLNLETTATAVLAWVFFREHLGRWAWIGNAGVLIAGVLLSLEGGRPGWIGSLFVAGAAVCWGLDNNWTALIDGITPARSTFWKGLVAGSVNLGLGLFLTPTAVHIGWLVALLVGALSYGASIVLYITAAQSLGATRSQMAFATAPFFGVAASVMFLGEALVPLQWIAFAVIALSLAVLFLESHEHEHVHEALRHTHSHRHDDPHHTHTHDGLPATHRHTHEHEHEPLVHAHPHWPDLHHRHKHRSAEAP